MFFAWRRLVKEQAEWLSAFVCVHKLSPNNFGTTFNKKQMTNM